ncbi:MAG: CotH kinase family protein [Firmicutes bacterium]|nr:CotH kinase family protein [Bacillota bacterium]
MAQTVGIRVRGASTRSGVDKSLTVFARKEYAGSDTFDQNVFDADLHSLILRSRPNPQMEGFLSSLIADRSVAVQKYEMVRLFINGEFWGFYSFMTRIDEQYLSAQYGVDTDDIKLLKIYYPSKESDEDADMYQEYEQYEDYFRHTDMSDPDHYRAACERVDMQSLIDSYVMQIYINNVDGSHEKNMMLWKTKNATGGKYSDGRWRYGLYDLDYALFSQVDDTEFGYDFNYFNSELPFTDALYEDPIFMSLMNSAAFREQFYQSFLEIAWNNFDPLRVRALLDALPYRDRNDDIAEFFDKRPLYIFGYLDDFMENYRAYSAADIEEISEAVLFLLLIFCLLMLWMIVRHRKRYGGRFFERKGS